MLRTVPFASPSTPLATFLLAAAALLAVPTATAAQTLSLLSATSTLTRAVEWAKPRNAEPRLLLPVEGIRPEELRDSYTAPRSGGRTHHAIDIHAPRGTPVLAVADGTVRKLHRGSRSGLSIHLLDPDGRTRYYYAHLDGYAEGLREGQRVRRGEVIGYVGDTGNAAPGDYHLHFSVAVLEDAGRWWEGRTLNPYELLRASRSRR